MSDFGQIMAAPPSGAFRFLDLPPELRSAVYQLVFQDQAPAEVDLLIATFCQPTELITKGLKFACRQLYHETKEYHLVARHRYWHRHTFVLHINGFDVEGGLYDHDSMLTACWPLKAMPIRSLRFDFHCCNNTTAVGYDLEVSTSHDGKLCAESSVYGTGHVKASTGNRVVALQGAARKRNVEIESQVFRSCLDVHSVCVAHLRKADSEARYW